MQVKETTIRLKVKKKKKKKKTKTKKHQSIRKLAITLCVAKSTVYKILKKKSSTSELNIVDEKWKTESFLFKTNPFTPSTEVKKT